MTTALPKRVAVRVEHTGDTSQDRAQRLARDVANAHELTKAFVAILANRSYAALATDTTIAAAAYATLLTAQIMTLAPTGFLLVTFTASGLKTTAQGTISFQVLLDGVPVKGMHVGEGASFQFSASMLVRAPVKAGPHTVQLQWQTNISGAQINAASVNEEHASMLVQESVS